MASGWIRAWSEEDTRAADEDWDGKERSAFRKGFTTTLREEADETSEALATLTYDDALELPDGIGDGDWTRVGAGDQEGFVPTEHVVELAWVAAGPGDDDYTAELAFDHGGGGVDLLWGDLVQIVGRDGGRRRVRCRGLHGSVDADRLTSEPLLELYFVDVGQGDGVLVRLPSGRHLLVDGGLQRANQMTGKNAADFVDWKFHEDYGDYAIRLDSLMASHCDADHYGGLRDLVRIDAAEDDELDCIEVGIAEFHHAGLSRWEDRDGPMPHKDELGPNDDGWFVRLLGDRADAEAAVVDDAQDELRGWWKWFVEDVLERCPDAAVTRLGVAREALQDGGPLPRIWPDEPEVAIHVLAPVTAQRDGRVALKDLGDRGENTNGHSICLRLDYGDARILLTGDLNKPSMDWIAASYGDRIAAFECDVVKGCHHGSADISYRFLQHVRAATTVISSGDAEGFAHPRPEVVAASAVSGHVTIDHEADRLRTPLVYMTEIERSVSLGQVSHVRFRSYPAEEDGESRDGALFALPLRDISDSALPTREDRREIAAADDGDEADEIEDQAEERERTMLEELDERQRDAGTRADYHYRKVHELFDVRYGVRSVWRSRIMTRNHYGLVNVRTDGETVLCATMKEEGGGWTVHTFPARFGS